MNPRSSCAAAAWRLAERAIALIEKGQPAAQLLARWYVAAVFFRSGLTKIQDWETTLLLFQEEYHVPLLPPDLAAWLGTGGELILPVFLVLGFGGRFAAAGLFVVNLMAVLSLAEIPEAALQQHVFWGSLLAGLVLWGPGRWSADAFLSPRLRQRLLGAADADRARLHVAASTPR